MPPEELLLPDPGSPLLSNTPGTSVLPSPVDEPLLLLADWHPSSARFAPPALSAPPLPDHPQSQSASQSWIPPFPLLSVADQIPGTDCAIHRHPALLLSHGSTIPVAC